MTSAPCSSGVVQATPKTTRFNFNCGSYVIEIDIRVIIEKNTRVIIRVIIISVGIESCRTLDASAAYTGSCVAVTLKATHASISVRAV